MKRQTVIGHTVSISGDIIAKEDLIIEGAVTSNKIDVGIENTVVIGLNAIVRAKSIVAGTVIITGDAECGSIYAETQVMISSTGKQIGDVNTSEMEIEPKGYFSGTLTLRKLSA